MSVNLRGCYLSLGVVFAGCANISVERIPWEPTRSDQHIADGDLPDEDLPDEDADIVGDIDAEIDVDAAAGLPRDAGATVDDARVGDAASGVVDAGGQARPDAGGADAGVLDGGHDAGAMSCGGRVVFGLCWYLGASGDSCNEACSRNGGFDPRAIEYVGTSNQGGSLAECTQVMRAFGIAATVGEGKRSDDLGAGCHLWTDGAPWWLDDPSERFAAGEDASGVRIACACAR